jgi:hypothetical protein
MLESHRRFSLGFALGAAALMIAQQIAGKATRDALFLSQFDVSHLPKVVIAGALVSLAGVFAMSTLLSRFGPRQVVPATFMMSAVLFVLEYLLLGRFPGLTAVLLYVHMTGFGAIVISGFWSLINERFDPHSAKPRIARIAAGAALGGVLGGVLAHGVAGTLGLSSMLLMLCLLNVACAGTSLALGGRPRGEGNATASNGIDAAAAVLRSPYLRNMAALLVLIAIMAALLDFALKAEAASAFSSREELVSFFASFYAVAGVVGFLLQSMLGPRVLERFGIGFALATLPVVVMTGGIAGSLAARLSTAALLRGAHAVLGNSLFRASFELLYAPLPPPAKRATKPIIDVAADRLGDVLGGGVILLLLLAAPDLPSNVMLLLAALAAAAALVVVARLHRGYVEQLAGTLRSGAVSFDEDDVLDATTRRLLAETTASADRKKVLERLKALKRDRAQRRPALPGPIFGGEASPGSGEGGEQEPDGEVTAALPEARPLPELALVLSELCSEDSIQVRTALTGPYMDIRLVPQIVRLLDHKDVGEDARMELRWVVPRIIGQLSDALLDPDLPLTVRQRIPAVMEVCHNPRVVRALLDGVCDGEFSVRYSSARALARMRSRDGNLAIPQDVVYRAVHQEVAVSRQVWQQRTLGTALDGDFEQVGELLDQKGTSLSLDHVFTLLGLVLDRDALHLALQALSSDNRNLRGTALEYLDNVLPDDLRRRLWQHLGLHVPASRGGHGARPGSGLRPRPHPS